MSLVLRTEKDERMRWNFGNYGYLCARLSEMEKRKLIY